MISLPPALLPFTISPTKAHTQASSAHHSHASSGSEPQLEVLAARTTSTPSLALDRDREVLIIILEA